MKKRPDALENKLLEKGGLSKSDRNTISTDERSSPENGDEICNVWSTPEVLGFSGEQQLDVLKSYCTKEKIMPTSSDLIQKQDNSLEVHEDHCDALSTVVDDASTGQFAAKVSDNRPASVKGVWQRDLKPTSNDDKISDTKSDDPSSKQIAEKNKKFKDELEAPPERAPLGDLRKKLLILDINGLLADIQSHTPKGYKVDKRIAKRAVFKRPFCSEFLKFCFERFDVGIWSSRTKKNVEQVVDYLLGDMKHKLLFCWDLSHCTDTGFKTLENRHKTLVFKELRNIWDKRDPNLPWPKGDYNESNTLLVDDSPYKALLNPPHTAIFPNSYTYQDKSDNSLGLGGELQVYLEGLAMAGDVKMYVERHPFGQSALTEQSPSWGYYHSILRAVSSSTMTG